MSINELLKRCEDPSSPISYAVRQQYTGSSGEVVLGMDALSISASVNRDIIGQTQVVRRPGLGDKVFGLAATYAYMKANPDADVTFSGLDSDNEGWLKKCIDWVKIGVNENCKTIVNLDNTPCNGGDRTKLMGNILGIEVDTIEFPIKIPRYRTPKKPYYIFAPFASRQGPRSLPYGIADEIMATSNVPLVFTDATRYNIRTNSNTLNLSGVDILEVIAIIADSEGIVGVDSGLVWLASALGRPAMIMFAHVPAKDRTMTCQKVVAIEPNVKCCPCGDHVKTMPECRFRQKIPVCMSQYTAEFVKYNIEEFSRMVSA